MLAELVAARGIRRLEVFWGVIGALSEARDVRELTSARYLPDPSGFMSSGINEVLAYINDNLTEPFSETDLARIAGLSTGAFSRSFRRHTGLALVQFVTRLRVNFACQLLMETGDLRITDVCFASGFNNLSNFNRQFLKHKGMTPSRFRALLSENFASGGVPGARPHARSRQSERRRAKIPSTVDFRRGNGRDSPDGGPTQQRRKRMLTRSIGLTATPRSQRAPPGTAALAQPAARWPS